MYSGSESNINIRSVPLADLRDIDHCINWIGRNLFGPAGAKWAKVHAQSQNIDRSDQLLRDIAILWPGSILINEVLPFEFVSRFLDPAFIEVAPRDKIIEYSYHLALGRPPDLSGLSHYEKQLENKRRISNVINDITSSDEARSFLSRKILTRNDLNSLKSEIKLRNSMMFFRKPKTIDRGFFDRQKSPVAFNETKSEWHFVYKDRAKNLTILSPGINLVGSFDNNTTLKCGPDWVLYGPKIPLLAGKYDMSIEMDAPSDFSYNLDASYGGGLSRICEMKLRGDLNIKLSFETAEDIDDFEIRILNLTGNSSLIDIKNVSIKKI